MKNIAKLPWVRLTLGFFFCALSTSFEIHSRIGASPWSVFHQGISKLTGISFGQVSILTSLLIVTVVSLAGLKVGMGTVCNMFLIGWMIDFFDDFGLIADAGSMQQSVMMIFLSMIFNAIGSYLYISCALGCGPRDGLMSILTKKLQWPVGRVRFLIEGSVLAIGWMLGGTAGIGTVLCMAGIGPIVQEFYKIMGFQIAEMKHATIQETVCRMKG